MKSGTALFFRLISRNHFNVSALVVLAVLTALAVSARGWWGMAFNAEETGRLAVQGQSRTFPIVLLNLTRFGFEPSAMKIPAGRCQLAIRNMTGLEDIDLQVARKNGERLLVEKYPKGRRHWEKPLTLPVGDYVISVVSHPQWTFSLTVTPPGR